MKNDINLATSLPNNVLSNISSYLKEAIEEDKKSRQPWLDEINAVKPYLGFTFEKINGLNGISELVSDIVKYNFQTFDSTLTSCVYKLWCLIRGQILPRLGPVGVDKNIHNNAEYVRVAEFVTNKLNSFLTKEDKGYYPDYDKFLFYLIFYGSVTRKTFNDPCLKRPISRFIVPEDFLVDNQCQSIEESNRLTHILHLSKREIILACREGRFIDPGLTYLDDGDKGDDKYNNVENSQIDLSVYSKKSSFEFQESHVYLDLKAFFTDEVKDGSISLSDLPSPYIITRCVATDKIVSIVNNWLPEDTERKRINCFVHYNLFPGFNLYSIGLAQLLGGNAMALTKIQRMIIDAAVHQNFPGGAYSSGAETVNTNINVVPGTFIPLDSGLHSLKDSLMPFPFQGASPVMIEISKMLTEQMQQLSGTTEITVSADMQNAPVGTTLAALEVNNRLQSTILQTIHKSFSDELQLLYEHFNFPIDYYDVLELSQIIPVSEPSIESTTQRIIKAETIMKLASSQPEMHNMYNVFHNLYESLGVDDVGKFLVSEEEMANKKAQEMEASSSQPQPIDPAQVEMADIAQRTAEVESRERIEHLKLEGQGYKTQMELALQEQKIAYESEQNKIKNELEAEKLLIKEKEIELKKQLELLKIETQTMKDNFLEKISELEVENQILRTQA